MLVEGGKLDINKKLNSFIFSLLSFSFFFHGCNSPCHIISEVQNFHPTPCHPYITQSLQDTPNSEGFCPGASLLPTYLPGHLGLFLVISQLPLPRASSSDEAAGGREGSMLPPHRAVCVLSLMPEVGKH